MQQSSTMDKLGPVGTIIRWVWTFRKLISIVALALSLLYLLMGETLHHRRSMLADFSSSIEDISIYEQALKTSGDRAFQDPSRTGESIETSVVKTLYSDVQKLRSRVTALTAPNNRIRKAQIEYLNSLSELQGVLNLFEPGEDGTVAVLTALNDIEMPASQFNNEAVIFKKSVWRSFFAAL